MVIMTLVGGISLCDREKSLSVNARAHRCFVSEKCLKNLRCYASHFFYCLDLDSGGHEQSFPINLINTLSVL